MTYILHGNPRSGSFTVEACLAEAQQPVELRDVDLRGEALRQDAYRALNPAREIPTLMLPDGARGASWARHFGG